MLVCRYVWVCLLFSFPRSSWLSLSFFRCGKLNSSYQSLSCIRFAPHLNSMALCLWNSVPLDYIWILFHSFPSCFLFSQGYSVFCLHAWCAPSLPYFIVLAHQAFLFSIDHGDAILANCAKNLDMNSFLFHPHTVVWSMFVSSTGWAIGLFKTTVVTAEIPKSFDRNFILFFTLYLIFLSLT